MLLAADVGNTNVVFALFDDSVEGTPALKARWRIATDPRRTGDEYAVWLLQLLKIEGVSREDITRIIVASVVPRADHNLDVLSQKYFGITPLFAGQGAARWRFEIDVDQPSTLGADRALNILAAHHKYGGDIIAVDFGTATTFDVVAADGAYVGGVIASGVNLSLAALHNAAAALPHVDITKPQAVVGTNTVACMQSGVFWGYIGLVREICARIKAERDVAMQVISTGGLAPLFQQSEALFDAFDEDLTMHGLTVIHRYNKDNA